MGNLVSDAVRDTKVDLLSTRLINFHHRRITNADPAVDKRDYIIKQQLDDALKQIIIQLSSSAVVDDEGITHLGIKISY